MNVNKDYLQKAINYIKMRIEKKGDSELRALAWTASVFGIPLKILAKEYEDQKLKGE